MTRAGIAVAILGCLFWIGCEESQPIRSPSAGKATAGTKTDAAGSPARETRGASAAAPGDEETATLPSDFPADVPLYQGATIAKVSDRAGTYNVQFRSNDAAKRIFAFYQEKLKAAQWRIGQTMDAKVKLLTATKGSASLTLIVGEINGHTSIDLKVEGASSAGHY